MKKNVAIYITVLTLLAALAIPVGMSAQNSQDQGHQAHHYQLVGTGTFGGPQSYLIDTGLNSGTFLNDAGVFTGSADTSTPDPQTNVEAGYFCFNLDCFVSHAFQWRNGVMTDLGALVDGFSSAPVAVSANGLIVGFSQNGVLDPLTGDVFVELRAVLWQNGRITDLKTLPEPEGGYESVANGVNSLGQVVGAALNTIYDPNSLTLTLDYVYAFTQVRAFLWQQGVMQDLGTLGGPDAVALLINEPGQVVGWSYTSSTPAVGCFSSPTLALDSFIWEKGKGMRDLGNLGGTCTLARALNNQGQVVGLSDFKGDQSWGAFRWENGKLQELHGLGGSMANAFALNEAGVAVGNASLPGNAIFHATLWGQDGQARDLGTVGTDPCSYAISINANGQIVGDSKPGCGADTDRSFLWGDGAIYDLNALIPPGSGLYLKVSYNINDLGEIAGTGLDAFGYEHAFLAIPCDQNHPNVEGCDYSLVDASAVAQADSAPVTALPTAAGNNNSPMALRRQFRGRFAHRYPGLGVQSQK